MSGIGALTLKIFSFSIEVKEKCIQSVPRHLSCLVISLVTDMPAKIDTEGFSSTPLLTFGRVSFAVIIVVS